MHAGDGSSCGVNPKINNLFRAYESAKYDLLWICDSNVLVKPDTLTCAVLPFSDPKVKARANVYQHSTCKNLSRVQLYKNRQLVLIISYPTTYYRNYCL